MSRLAAAARSHRAIALYLCIVATATLHYSSKTLGFTRDEGYYFDAGELYWEWFSEVGEGVIHGKPLAAFSRAAIDRGWNYNHEHPPLMKCLFGMSWRLFHKCNCPKQQGRHPLGYGTKHRTLGIFTESEAMRFPSHLFGGIMVALAFLFAARAWSTLAGLVAGVLSLAAPHIFFHSNLSCFDAPMATTWLLVVYCYWRSLDERKWAWRTGVAFGFALITKLNAFFLPPLLIAHYLWVRRDRLRALKLPPIPASFAWMGALGPVMHLGLWPWMWFDTVTYHPVGPFLRRFHGRFPEYVMFHVNHVYYNFEYLGINYNKPPFPRSTAFVMTLFTAPVTTLLLALVGTILLAVVALRRKEAMTVPAVAPDWHAPAAGMDKATGLLVFGNALFPPAIIAITGAPIFGGTKHWLTAIPFIAILAGVACDRFVRALRANAAQGSWPYRLAPSLVALVACAPGIAETVRSHPYGMSHYNLLAGGPAGAADLGMNRQFWGYATRGILTWLNRAAHQNAPVYWHDANQIMLNMDVREQFLRDDIGNTGLEEPGVKASDYAMVVHEKHFNKYEYWIWDFYGTARPSKVLTLEGVPLVTTYTRPPMENIK